MNDYFRIDLWIIQTLAGLCFGQPGYPRLDEDPRRYNGRGVRARWKLAEIPGRRSGNGWSLPQTVRDWGDGAFAWQSAVVPAQNSRPKMVSRITPSTTGKYRWLA